METKNQTTVHALIVTMVVAWIMTFWLFVSMDSYRKIQVKALRTDVTTILSNQQMEQRQLQEITLTPESNTP